MHAVADLEPDRCKDDRDTRMLGVLIAHGFDVFQKNIHGRTPMYNAVRSHNVSSFRYLYPLLMATREDSNDILDVSRGAADEDVSTEIENIVKDITQQWCVAFAMGFHQRLGVGSRVIALNPELLRIVLVDFFLKMMGHVQ